MIRRVISNGYCIGCGACAAVSPQRYEVALDRNGFLQAREVRPFAEEDSDASKVCPFSDDTMDEDRLASVLFAGAPHIDKATGRYIECFVGRVSNDALHKSSSSGGVGRWLLRELLAQGLVDYVVHVVPNDCSDVAAAAPASPFPLYKYEIASSPADLERSAKSAYYPVQLAEVIECIKANPGRYAITGVPCFIKAIRNLALIDPCIAERIRFTVGIVCGHLKSTFYAEMIGWQLGVRPSELVGLDFRVKIAGKKANEKGVSAERRIAGWTAPRTVQRLFGTGYAHGYFKYEACDYCDDVLAEAADVSVGDAWLPEFLTEGASIVVVRNAEVLSLIRRGIETGGLCLSPIAVDRIALSQAGGLRHRREGLAYRLFLRAREGKWAPRKRIAPAADHISSSLKNIFRLRMELSKRSVARFEQARSRSDWNWFVNGMRQFNERYSRAQLPWIERTVFYRIIRKAIAALSRRFKADHSSGTT